MNAALVYVLLALPAGQYQGSVDVHVTVEQPRCEVMAKQLNAVDRKKVYKCETLVQVKA